MTEYIVLVTCLTPSGYKSKYMSDNYISNFHSKHPQIPRIPNIDNNVVFQMVSGNVLITKMLAEGAEPICAACSNTLPTTTNVLLYDKGMVPPGSRMAMDMAETTPSLKKIDHEKTKFVIVNSHKGLETVKGKPILRHWVELMLVCHRSACSKKIESKIRGIPKRCPHLQGSITKENTSCACKTPSANSEKQMKTSSKLKNVLCCSTCASSERQEYPFHLFMKDRTCMYCNGLMDEDDKILCKSRHCMKKCMVKDLKYELVYKCGTCDKVSKSKMSKCSLCERVYYCDRKCQKEDWSHHKTECEKINRELITVMDSNGDVQQLSKV
jgi:hypothetical protein